MTDAPLTGVVVDTMVVSWLLDERGNPAAELYRELIGAAPVLLAFQTVMELRFGALRAGWGELRRRRLELRLAELTVVQPDDRMITLCAELRAGCQRVGHALGHKLHDGDRWIAATALQLDCALATDGRLFRGVPGLRVLIAQEP
jgi:predicted nucleic acid-binding protein